MSALARPVVAIHQPAYLPWLGYLDRIRRADTFVFLDTVPFQKNSFQNRNKVRTARGWTWLTVPLATRGHTARALHEMEIDESRPWRRKHWATIRQAYAHAPFAERAFAWLGPLYERPWGRLADLCWEMLARHLDAVGIATRVVRARDLADPGSRKSALLLELCRGLGARSYLSGPLGRGYLDETAFARAGIAVAYDDYRHPRYPQAHPGFESHMAAIDLIANAADPLPVLASGSA